MDLTKEAKKAMIDKDLTMSDVGKKLGISTPYVSELIAGTRRNPEKIQQIKDLLGLEGGDSDDTE